MLQAMHCQFSVLPGSKQHGHGVTSDLPRHPTSLCSRRATNRARRRSTARRTLTGPPRTDRATGVPVRAGSGRRQDSAGPVLSRDKFPYRSPQRSRSGAHRHCRLQCRKGPGIAKRIT